MNNATPAPRTPPQPQMLVHGAEVGIDEAMIRTLVETFYARIRADALLGPIFNSAIDDWDAHLAKLSDFWSSVVLRSGRYKGMPMPAHARLNAISGAHFDHWLALFADTAREICPADAAALFIDRSQRIARSLEMGVALHRGEMLALGERLAGPRQATG